MRIEARGSRLERILLVFRPELGIFFGLQRGHIMASRAPKPASDSASASPERVVLWFEDGKSNKVYVAERNGARWTARYGKRTQETRAEKIYELSLIHISEPTRPY